MTANDHNKLVGIFLMVHGVLNTFVMLLVTFIYGGVGVAMLVGAKDEEKFVGAFFIAFVLVFFVIIAVFMLPQIIGGVKMYRQKPNAMTWGIIGSILATISFPLGTALGVYGLWFLFGDQGKYLYEGGANMMRNPDQPPPPPNSWQ